MKYSEPHVPILYGPQISRQDRDDTRERYCRAVLTLFVPWRTVIDLCDIHQIWEEAFKTRRHLVLRHSWTIIENSQLLHECKKDCDDHLLQVIAEAPTENDSIDSALLPTNQEIDTEYAGDESDELLELLGTLDENTVAMFNAAKSLTESKYIEGTIETVKNVGRFNPVHCKYCFKLIFGVSKSFGKILVASDQYSANESNMNIDELLIPLTPARLNLVRINRK